MSRGGEEHLKSIGEEAAYIRQVVKKLNSFIDRSWQAEAQKADLTRPQVSVIHELFDNPGLSLKELSIQMGLAHSTLSGIIDRLEKKCLVERRTDHEDKRISRLYVSSKVDSYVAKDLSNELDAPVMERLSRLSKEERSEIRNGLAVLERIFI